MMAMTALRKFTERQIMSVILSAGLLQLCSSAPVFTQDLQNQKEQNVTTLGEINQQLQLSQQRKAGLIKEIALLKQDRGRISGALIETARRTQEIEGKLNDVEGRLVVLGGQEYELKQSLAERSGLLSQVLAALQRMGRKPPPALLVQPEDALASVRSAALLAAVLPELRAETSILLTDLKELARLRQTIGLERKQHAIHIKTLVEDRARLSLLVDEKLKLEGTTRAKLIKQGEVARSLGEKAKSMRQLIASLNAQIDNAELATRNTRETADARRRAEDERLAIARSRVSGDSSRTGEGSGRMKPAIRFSESKGRLQLPVNGVEVLSFGEKTNTGARAKGALIATRANALVVSPVDARIVYAGPFRSYGKLLILDVGAHMHIVMSGMEQIVVGAGQFVLAGEPVAKMGARRIASVASLDIASSRPMLYVEFRKDGKSFDPSPWWADNSMKRSNNDT